MPLGNEIQLSKYPGWWNFTIYMESEFYNIYGYGVYLQNTRRGCLLFPAPSGGRFPLEMKYNYSSTLGHGVSKYILLWGSISKTLLGVACFFLHLQQGDALWKWNIIIQVPWVMEFQNIHGYGVYLQSRSSGCLLFLHLQEGDVPWKWNIFRAIQVPWVMEFQNIYGYGGQSPKPYEGCLLFLHLQVGDALWKWNIISQIPWVMEF